MKAFIALQIALILACLLHSCIVHAQVQTDDVAFARNDKGNVLALSSQSCPMAGFYWWHMESAEGKTLHTGCWTLASHRRVMITDGKGGATYLPIARFSGNPAFGE